MKKKLLSYLVIACLTFNVLVMFGQKRIAPSPKWLEKSVFYQLYPQSFKDTNGDGIGDIQGIIQELDYIKSIGCDAIWLNPCFESPFKDAGYDVVDYYKVAPRYGTNKDLELLFEKAHKKGIKICLDLVAGHTSDQHEWFKKSRNKEGEYSDRFIWTKALNVDNNIIAKGGLNRYVKDSLVRHAYFMKNFFDCQPAINYGFAKPLYEWEQTVNSPAAIASRQELFHIMDFWMSRGADGFRVDMASSLIKRDEDFKETGKLWAEIKTKFQQKYPEGVLISEWGNPEQAVRAGFMIDFMIHFGVKGYPSLFFNQEGVFKRKDCYFSAEGNGSPVEFVENYMSQLKAVSSNGYVSVPTSNHDIQRPFSGTRNTEEQLKVVMTFILTLKGMPFIYYGDEIGMRFVSGLQDKEGSQLEGVSEDGVALGNRAGTRTPMQWNRGTNAGFSTCNKSQLYLPIDPQATNNNVEDQNKNQASLLNLTRKLIKLRKENNALGNTGDIKFIYAKENSYPLVYTRKSGKSQFLIVVNPSGKEAVAKINIEKKLTLTPILNESVDINIINKSMVINSKKFSYCIYKISGSIF